MGSDSMIAILSGLAAAFSWGAGDFAGGLASRRAAAVRVVITSQIIGGLALVLLGLLIREPLPAAGDLRWGMVAGVAGGSGLLLLYLSLARGKMGIAAPLTAVAAGGLPLLVGVFSQGLPGPIQIVGFLIALVAIIIVSDIGERTGLRPIDLLLPLLAGVGFGVFLSILGLLGDDAGFIWPVVAARATSIPILTVVLLGLARRGSPLAAPTIGRFPWGLAAAAALGDTAGNIFYVLSASTGRLAVAAVLGALYPAATVLLARYVLNERLTRRQSVGVVLSLVAVALIAL